MRTHWDLTSWVLGLYDDLMTMPPSPPCDRCGRPVVEAHYPDGRCPRPARRAARKAVRVSGAIAGVILLVVAALVFWRVNGTRELSLGGPTISARAYPSEQACAVFKRWEASAGWAASWSLRVSRNLASRSHSSAAQIVQYHASTNTRLPGNIRLLYRAVEDAYNPRVRLPMRLRLRLEADLTVLQHVIQQESYAHSPPPSGRASGSPVSLAMTTISDEKSIQKDCRQIAEVQGQLCGA